MEDTGPNPIIQALQLIDCVAICDRCLGRQFAWLSTDTSNESRGYSLKLSLSILADSQYKSGIKEKGIESLRTLAENGMFQSAAALCTKYGIDFTPQNNCQLCMVSGSSVFERIPSIIERVVHDSKGIEFDSFLVGTAPVDALEEFNEEIRGKFEISHAEPLKSEFNRTLGKELSHILEKEVDFERPDLVVFYDMETDKVDLRINPVFIYGRYRKLVRGIPQSRWDCRKCKGKGCEECNGTGRNYQDSVSEYIALPIQDALQGTKFKFHAAGREDIDVLMLGSGRPFVAEISEPKLRHPDLVWLKEKINNSTEGKVEVGSLEMATRDKLQMLKISASESVKEYEALIVTEDEVTEEALTMAAGKLHGAILDQRTPNRVSHRRSDLVRKKEIIDLRLTKKESHLLEGYFKVQGGTYIKELISGDEGRTTPSLSQVLGTRCTCKQLNVTAVHS